MCTTKALSLCPIVAICPSIISFELGKFCLVLDSGEEICVDFMRIWFPICVFLAQFTRSDVECYLWPTLPMNCTRSHFVFPYQLYFPSKKVLCSEWEVKCTNKLGKEIPV